MKLLVCGDFHGRFPKKILQVIKKDKIDLLISNGDYASFFYRDLWFKYCYRKDVQLWQIIGKKKFKEIILKDVKSGERVFKKLGKLHIPVITVFGNLDYGSWDEAFDNKNKRYSIEDVDFFNRTIQRFSNITNIDYSFVRLGNFVIIGGGPSSFPGQVKSKMYRKLRKILDKNFKKFGKELKAQRVIFLSHNVPYNTKLDKVTSKKARSEVRGKHYGSKLVRRIIDKYHPALAIGGHIHESRGMQKLGKTVCVNPGALYEGHYAIVEIDDKTRKIKVELK